MGDVINLRSARKTKARAAAAAQADANRLKYGRSKQQKLADAAEEARRNHVLDSARRDVDTD